MNNQESLPSSFLLSIMMEILACSIRHKRRKKKKKEYSKGRDKTIPTADSMIIYTENSKGLQKEGGKNFLELISEFSMISRYKYKIKCISI